MTLQFALNRLFVVTANLGSVFENVSLLFGVSDCLIKMLESFLTYCVSSSSNFLVCAIH